MDPPLHLSQTRRQAFREGAPYRPVPLRLDVSVPAAIKLHLQMMAEIERVSLADHLLARIIGGAPSLEKLDDPWTEIVEQAIEWIQDPENLERWKEAVPVEDPYPEHRGD